MMKNVISTTNTLGKALLTLLFLIGLTVNTQAATITWVGGDGYWEDANNWSGGVLPGNSDHVIIPSGGVM